MDGGITAGAISAMRPNSIVDYAVTVLSTIGISVPTFVLVLFFVHSRLWIGMVPGSLMAWPSYMVLPVLTLAAQPMAFIARLTRSGFLTFINKNTFVQLAQKVWVLGPFDTSCPGNAILPVITYLGPLAASLLTVALLQKQFCDSWYKVSIL